jgi:hypothetical protein
MIDGLYYTENGAIQNSTVALQSLIYEDGVSEQLDLSVLLCPCIPILYIVN